jgi:hypothetical protein
MDNGSALLGRASLWASFIGTTLPVVSVFVDVIWWLTIVPRGLRGAAMEIAGAAWVASLGLRLVLFVMIEMFAFGCGLAAIHTRTGKAGLLLSVGLLLLLLSGLAFMIFNHVRL